MTLKIPGPRDFAAYIIKIRYSVYTIVLLMLFSFLLGVIVAVTMPSETEKLMSMVASSFSAYKSLTSFDLMVSLFLHNALICLLMAVLGLALGVITLIIAFDNGLILGLVSGAAVGKAGLLFTIAAILPHGILELPAMILSAAIGLHLGYTVLLALFRRPVDIIKEIKDAGLIFVTWLLPLLLAAAFVESFVTTAIVYYLIH